MDGDWTIICPLFDGHSVIIIIIVITTATTTSIIIIFKRKVESSNIKILNIKNTCYIVILYYVIL